MEIFNLIANLEELINSGSKNLFTNKVSVDRDELSEILEEVRLNLPAELKQAKKIKDERISILKEAEEQAATMLKEAEGKIVQMVDAHEITKQAIMQKEQIVENANRVSKEISCGTRDYADAILERVEEVLRETMQVVQNNRKELK